MKRVIVAVEVLVSDDTPADKVASQVEECVRGQTMRWAVPGLERVTAIGVERLEAQPAGEGK